MPIRRPRRGKPSSAELEGQHTKFIAQGRALKYSGESRYSSSYPPTHREHRPLADPPQQGTPYHRFAGEIARLELVDALLCFIYALWCTDLRRNDTAVRQSWVGSFEFLGWVKNRWSQHDSVSEAEKAFVGLM
jgi:hypothetical protein